MAYFSDSSLDKLKQLDTRLVNVLMEAIKHADFTVLETHRGEDAQNQAFADGRSKVKWPDGKHNKLPSLAVDIAPWPIDWKNRERFCHLAGLILGIGIGMGVKLKWGGDWNMDRNSTDERFSDMPHFEIVEG